MINPGAAEIRRAAEELASRLPDPLKPLAAIAFNYRWSWTPGGESVFRSIDAHRWNLCGENPVRLLQEASEQALASAAEDAELVRRADRLAGLLDEAAARPAADGPATAERPIAFMCTEFAVHRSLPVYSGGLGVLAGDLLKEAADRAIPMVGVGLMYRQGYFRQRLDASGWQHEYWTDTDPERLPAALVEGDDGLPVTIRVPVRGRPVTVQIWRVNVGRVPLFLLDAERPENDGVDRFITSRLYIGDRRFRLAQYALLGIGGMRALQHIGYDPAVVHLNEGHAALAPLELARSLVDAGNGFADALAAARSRTVFTTHTPVAAGNESYTGHEILEVLGDLPERLGADAKDVLALGRARPEDLDEPFGMTALGLRVARASNGVSRRHGDVARGMWRHLYPDGEVPIDHVTNGVHLPTWMAPQVRELLDRHLPDGWAERADDETVWSAVDAIPDAELWAVRNELRADLVAFARDRALEDRLSRGEQVEYVEAASRAFDPATLTIGFARRATAYKRLYLLTLDSERALALLQGEHRVQMLLSGKPHPADEEAKRILQGLFALKWAPHVAERVAFLEDYNMRIAHKLVAGCDVWVNVPRPPLEACGTSGMKAALNGVLNLSVLDGWWDEAYDGSNGWAIAGHEIHDHAAQDAQDASALYDLLEKEVVPLFYERGEDGIPHGWCERIKASLRSIGPQFNAGRMLRDYVAGPYAGAGRGD